MKADRKYLVVLVLAMFGVLAVTGAQMWPSPSGTGILLAAPHDDDRDEDEEEAEDREGEGPEFRVIGLEHQPAQKAMETIEQLFESDLFDAVRDKLALAVNEPANAIVVVGPERAVDLLEGMLRELDELTAEHHERMKDREAEHRERMRHEHAERREMEERERAQRRERGQDRPRGMEEHRPELRQENLRRYMEQMRKMREQMEHFFREYDRPREHDRRGSSFFERPGFRFEFHPDTKRPTVKKL